MKIERRHHATAEVRAATTDTGMRVVTLQPIVPNIVDDYGSVFMPDTFDASLEERMPTLAWAHSWQAPIGRAMGWSADGDLRAIEFRVADTQQARDAYELCQPGPGGEPAVIDDCSVGFSNTKRREPTDEELERWPGAVEIITKADLDEVSLVLRGAVPGAKVLSLRSAGGSVSEDVLLDLAEKVANGDLTEAAAKAALRLAADDAPPTPPELTGEPEPPVVDADAVIDDALAAYTDRSR